MKTKTNATKKTAVKNTTSTKAKESKQPKKTISSFVIATFKSQPAIKSNSMIELVQKEFGEKGKNFNVYHYSWYKYQIKKGRYNKLFEKSQLEKIFAK